MSTTLPCHMHHSRKTIAFRLHQAAAPVPWSSSPPSHYQPAPSKRGTLPWLKNDDNDKIATHTPLPADKNKNSPYPWNKTASALKNEQKELRKRNRQRGTQTKPESTAALIKKSSITQVPTTFLSEEQRGILKAVVDEGKSVFFTGSAGTGEVCVDETNYRETERQVRARA